MSLRVVIPVGDADCAVGISVKPVEKFNEIERRATAGAKRVTEDERRAVRVKSMSERRIEILLHQNVLRTRKVAEHINHILIHRLAVACRPFFLI